MIAREVARRTEAAPLELEWDWAARIAEVLPDDVELTEVEVGARAEKAAALEMIVRRPISVLIGPAGTGKTTMLEALCADQSIAAGGVLLLAPTGKAVVQLSARTKTRAQTLAKFLRANERWDLDGGYYLNPQGPRYQGAKTVVIDEASMLTEEMLAATIEALEGVERLILCGDPRQLPPIGAGRPFADLVALLREHAGSGGGVAELRTVPPADRRRWGCHAR